MIFTYHNLNIEIQAEGIIHIESLHIVQKLNEHGTAALRAVAAEEAVVELVEQTSDGLSVNISRSDGLKQVLFCGIAEHIRAERENGLFYLYIDFSGYTKQWDLVCKSRSFCKGDTTYEQVLTEVLSQYGNAQIRDEASGGAVIPGMLMQYEETDWTFIKRLASHFSTFILSDNTAGYGKVYFGIPRIDHGTVLTEEEYTLLKGEDRCSMTDDTDDIMPQEMMRWHLKSRKHMLPGEQVMLGHIETVVTAAEVKTEQGDLSYEYELSRRKGILAPRSTNPRIFGMSIPATIQERKGNQVRVQMDIDAAYTPSDSLKWFTYAIETSNFYCMPEEGSRVHIYFPSHDEQDAMAVHAIRMEDSPGSTPARARAVSVQASYSSLPSGSGGSGQSYHSSDSSLAGSNFSSSPAGGPAPVSAASGAAAGIPEAIAKSEKAQQEKQEKQQKKQEKDPERKIFSDPSGSYLELAPYGITFSPGNGTTSMVLQKTGTMFLSGLSVNFFCAQGSIFSGIGSSVPAEGIYMIAGDNLKISLFDQSSQITMQEDIHIISPFIRKNAELKNAAMPLASMMRAQLTANDAADRTEINMGAKEALTGYANAYKDRLAANEAAAKQEIWEGIGSLLGVVAGAALIIASGGTAGPVVIGICIASGAFKTASALSDIGEGVSDLHKAQEGDLSQSFNFMRDKAFGGNDTAYQFAKGVNDILFNVVTCKAVKTSLAKTNDTNKVVSFMKTANTFMETHKKGMKIANASLDFFSTCYSEYQNSGTISPVNVIINLGASNLKASFMYRNGTSASNDIVDIARKTGWGLFNAIGGTAIDGYTSLFTGAPFDLEASFKQNAKMAGRNEWFCDPVDVTSGSYGITESDLLLPDISDPVRLERNYSSTRLESGWLGKGWHFTYEGNLCIDGDIIHGQLPDGYCIAFRYTEDGFEDILGNGRYALTHETEIEKWVVTDTHQHKQYYYMNTGLLEEVIDRNQQRLTLSYQAGRLKQIRTALGYTIDFQFKDDRLTSMTDSTGRSMGYRYEKGLLTEVVHMDGGVTRYQYSEEGFLIVPTDQTGLSYLTNEYDEKGRTIVQTLINGEVSRITFHDREKRVCTESSAYPGERQYYYDGQCNITAVVYPDGTRKYFEYDEKGNRILEKDRLGRTTRRSYDGKGRLIMESLPSGLTVEYDYDRAGNLVSVRDNGGREKLFTYDASHNLINKKEKSAEGTYIERSYYYDRIGRLIRETDGEGHETSYRYDEGSAYPSATIYSDGTELKCEYSPIGRKLVEDDGAVRWEYAYNQGGWRTMERDGEGNETHTLYDGMGRKLALYTPKQWEKKDGKRTDFRYDFLARLVDTIYPDGSHRKLFRDGEGNILKEVHPNSYDSISGDGEGTRYDYDMENRLLRIYYPDGGTERFFYDAAGNRIKHVLPEQYDEKTDDGDGWTYAYDNGDRLISITGPDGIVMASYSYDLWGKCVQKTGSDGHSTYYAYDLMGRLIRELAPVKEDQGHISYRMTAYVYDDDGRCVREIRYGGTYQSDGTPLTEGIDLELAFAYDARGRLVKASDSLGARVSYRYDARGNRTSEEQIICAGEGRTVLRKLRYSYDRAGRLVRKTEILDDGLPDGISRTPETAVTTYAYDANGNRTRITTPEGYQISYDYDDRDRLITEHVEDQVNHISRTTRITYDKAGNIISATQEGKDGQSRKVSYDYDLKDRLTHAAELDGPVFDLSYDKNDQTAMQRRLLPAEKETYSETSFHYDMRGRLTEKYQDGILIERNGYDIRGNRTSIMDGDGVELTCQYGIQNEQTEIFTANSRKQGKTAQKLTYDARGRITGICDGMGGKTGYALDGWGRITAVHTPEGGQEQYAYDQAGNLITATDAKGGVTSYAYNSRGQISAITDQGGDTETFRYDKEGRQVQHTDRNGTVTETKYNVYGQPVLQACTDKKGNRQVMGTWEYDDFGQLKKSVAGGFRYTYAYRPDGRLLKKWSSGKIAVSCTYYLDGSLKSLTDISGKTVYYGYDEQGRLTSLTEGAEKSLIRYAYTAADRLKEIQAHNGFVASYEYDDDGNLSHLRIGSGEGGLLYDAFLSYDLNGNRTGKSGVRLGVDGAHQEIHISYQYDCMDRLTEENRGDHGERYSYDLAGNRTRKQAYHYALAKDAPVVDWEETYCYNERNELTEKRMPSTVARYLYDGNGSLVSVKEGGKVTSYRYDLLNRQTSVQMPDGRVQENLYDGEGLRAGVMESGKLSTFLYYNGEILTECNGESMPIKRRLLGMGISGLQTLKNGQFYACHQDEQGSTIYITGRGGAVENCYAYDAFGNTLEKKEGIQNRIQYTGQQYDQETGQYYLRARYYNPAVGRFTQEDTYRGDGLNLYAYCKNNPVVYYDPSGHDQAVNPSNGTEMTNTAGVEKGNLGDSSADAKISSGQSSGKSTDFYVAPNGDVVPATAYRYMNSKYAEPTMESMSAPGSYFGFEKFDSASDAMDAFQISPEWSDCKLRGEFDTLQVIDGMYVPLEYNGKGPNLEPFTRCYPEHGKGGSQQFVYDGVIHFKSVDIIDD